MIPDADLLFARANESGELTGMLSVTTYPLIGLRNAGEPALLFGSRYEAGYYMAALALLGKDATRIDEKYGPVLPKGPPSLWLTALGRGGYVPMRYPQPNWDADRHVATPPMPDFAFRPPPLWRVAAFAITILLGGLLLSVLTAQWSRGSRAALLRLNGGVARGASIAAITMSALAVWSPFATGLLDHFELYLPDWFAPALMLVVLFGAHALNRNLSGLPESFVVAIAAGAVVYFFTNRQLAMMDLFQVRMVDLTSGVSPTLPMLLMSLCLLWWGVIDLRRGYFQSLQCQDLPRTGLWSSNLAEAQKRFNAAFIDSTWVRLRWKMGRLITTLALLFGAWLSGPFIRPQSLEGPGFDWIFCICFSIITMLLFGEWARFIYAWGQLRKYLSILSHHPIRYAFGRVRSPHAGTLIWRGGPNQSGFAGQSRFIERLGRMVPLLTRKCDGAHDLERALCAENKTVFERDETRLRAQLDQLMLVASTNRRDSALVAAQLELDMCAVSTRLAARLETYWLRGGSPDWEKSAVNAELIAEEAVAIRYLAFIRYGFLQLRNILIFLSAGFLLMLLAVNSYPFQSQRPMIWLLTVFFVLLGGGIATMLAQADRDPIVSRLTNAKTGAVGWQFFVRLLSYGGLPLLGLLNSYFPWFNSISQTLLQPALDLLRK